MNICLVKIVEATENFSNMESLKAHEVLKLMVSIWVIEMLKYVMNVKVSF